MIEQTRNEIRLELLRLARLEDELATTEAQRVHYWEPYRVCPRSPGRRPRPALPRGPVPSVHRVTQPPAALAELLGDVQSTSRTLVSLGVRAVDPGLPVGPQLQAVGRHRGVTPSGLEVLASRLRLCVHNVTGNYI